jgi:hypothetical protein
MKVAASSHPRAGENDNGDVYVAGLLRPGVSPELLLCSFGQPANTTIVAEVPKLGEQDRLLLAVVDGVGHGSQAAAASETVTTALLASAARSDDPAVWIRECHELARASRGATLGVLVLDMAKRRLDASGLGNVRIEAWRAPRTGADGQALLARTGASVRPFRNNNGTVGHNIPSKVIVDSIDYEPGDVLCLYSDGIAAGFNISALSDLDDMDAERIADCIRTTYGGDADDATVVVAR